MKKLVFIFFLTIFPMSATLVSAEYYRYIDEKGQKRWTDDLNQVPKDQRDSAQRLESSEGNPTENPPKNPTDGQANQEQSAGPESSRNTEEKNRNGSNETVELSREALEKEKAELDALYRQLMEERKQLEHMQSEALNSDERAALKVRIVDYNTQTDRYESQLSAFNEKIKAYNQRITTTSSPKSE